MTLRSIPPWALAALLAAAYMALAPPSADLAAQYYRADLGLVVWDNGWYGGHHMPGYSVLYPPLGSALGARLVGALSAVAASWAFARLLRATNVEPPAARVAALWFAAATATSLITGRLTFSLGVALGLAALLAAVRTHAVWAVVLAALTALASPVAGAFLALTAVAWWLARRGWPPLALVVGALVPAAAVIVAFPDGGTFPFVGWSFWPALAAMLCVVVVVPREATVVRIGAALYALAMIASFAFATPMGGNVVRLGALLAGPVLAAMLWPRDRRMLALLAVPLLYWQWVAPVDDWVRSEDDASTHERYYAGMLSFLASQRGGPFRLEIPFTDNHWESRWVAPHVPLARGWERQDDREHNPVFYDGKRLTAARYRGWLEDNAVRFVALADAPIDYSAAREAQLVRDGLPYLREVWRDAHWRVFAVAGARPLATGAARVTALGTESVRLSAHGPGTVDLRVRFTPYWRLQTGRGCVEKGAQGWTRLRLDAPGPVVLHTDFALSRVRASSPRCTPR